MPRLYALDALRALAAVIVVFAHFIYEAQLNWYDGFYVLSVDFFLMLSGFVMARSYEGRLSSDSNALAFLGKRYRRLFPFAALGLFFAIILVVVEGGFSWETAAIAGAALFFLPWPSQGWLFPLNPPRWSLFAELVANFLHAAVFARCSVRRLLEVTVFGGVLLIWSAVQMGVWPGSGYSPHFMPGLVRMVLAYIIGIVIFRIPWASSGKGFNLPTLCLILIASVYLGGLLKEEIAGPIFLFIVCPVLLIGGIRSVVSPAAEVWCSAAGRISYPLYAIHVPLIGLALWFGVSPIMVLLLTIFAIISAIGLLVLIAKPADTSPVSSAQT